MMDDDGERRLCEAVGDEGGGEEAAQPDRVLIVVDADLDHLLHQAAGGALVP